MEEILNNKNDNECPICYENIIDPIYFSCNVFHKICFKCLLDIINKSENKFTCIYCRGGDNNIIINKKDINNESENIKPEDVKLEHFESLKFFMSCFYYLNKICDDNLDNKSIINFNILKIYTLNKDNLLFSKKNENFLDKECLFKILNWKKYNNTDDIVKEFYVFEHNIFGHNIFGQNSVFGQNNEFQNNDFSHNRFRSRSYNIFQ